MKRNEKSREAKEGKWMTRNETPKESKPHGSNGAMKENPKKLY